MALADNALTTVAAVCRELARPVPGPSEADTLADLEERIAAASDSIEGWCGRSFGRFSGAERVAGYGTDVLCLERYPIQAISGVQRELFGGDLLDVEPWSWRAVPDRQDAAAGLLRNTRGTWLWTTLLDDGPYPGPMPGREQRTYVVTYTGGYVLPKDATPSVPRTLPFDLERACILTVLADVLTKGRDQSIISESILSSSVTYAGSTLNTAIGRGLGGLVPDNAIGILGRYRRIVTCG